MSDIQNSAATEPATPQVTQNTDGADTSTQNDSGTSHEDTSHASDGGEETLGGPRLDPQNDAVKDPEDWVTGDEPMTGPQKSYLDTLAREAGEELPASLSKAEASEHIDRLQKVTGRGQ